MDSGSSGDVFLFKNCHKSLTFFSDTFSSSSSSISLCLFWSWHPDCLGYIFLSRWATRFEVTISYHLLINYSFLVPSMMGHHSLTIHTYELHVFPILEHSFEYLIKKGTFLVSIFFEIQAVVCSKIQRKMFLRLWDTTILKCMKSIKDWIEWVCKHERRISIPRGLPSKFAPFLSLSLSCSRFQHFFDTVYSFTQWFNNESFKCSLVKKIFSETSHKNISFVAPVDG